jgi:iron complex outermembrane receptor protein
MTIFHGAPRVCALVALPASLALAGAATAAADRSQLEEVVVTAARMQAPLLVTTDPQAPRQPLPAHDGADFLKTIPGFSVIRKGGTDGDPVFRGMAASRVNILLDGEQVLGGCGMRMDPPTAYVFPEAYDRIVVVKGPQTVLHGPGNSAASVSFERTWGERRAQ